MTRLQKRRSGASSLKPPSAIGTRRTSGVQKSGLAAPSLKATTKLDTKLLSVRPGAHTSRLPGSKITMAHALVPPGQGKNVPKSGLQAPTRSNLSVRTLQPPKKSITKVKRFHLSSKICKYPICH